MREATRNIWRRIAKTGTPAKRFQEGRFFHHREDVLSDGGTFRARPDMERIKWLYIDGLQFEYEPNRGATRPAPISIVRVFWIIPLDWQIANAVQGLFTPWAWGALFFTFVHQKIGWRWRSYFIFAGAMRFLAGVTTSFPAIARYQPLCNSPVLDSDRRHHSGAPGKPLAQGQIGKLEFC